MKNAGKLGSRLGVWVNTERIWVKKSSFLNLWELKLPTNSKLSRISPHSPQYSMKPKFRESLQELHVGNAQNKGKKGNFAGKIDNSVPRTTQKITLVPNFEGKLHLKLRIIHRNSRNLGLPHPKGAKFWGEIRKKRDFYQRCE